MAAPIVAFDEAGNSGGNLLDDEQPVFVLASVYVPDSHTFKELMRNKNELKFSNLRRNASGQSKIINILELLKCDDNSVLKCIYHKQYMIITMMIDLLIEPLVYARGINLYYRGQNLAMANLMYKVLPHTMGKQRFDGFLASFVNMIKGPDKVSIDAFYRIVKSLLKISRTWFLDDELAILLDTRPIAEKSIGKWDSGILDPAISSFFIMAAKWPEVIGETCVFVCDNSKIIEKNQEFLEASMSPEEKSRIIGFDRRKIQYPIRAKGIEFRDSKKCLRIQLADIVAGSTAYWLRKQLQRRTDSFSDRLQQVVAINRNDLLIWPSDMVTPWELGTEDVNGIDPNNYVGKYISDKMEGFPDKSPFIKQETTEYPRN